MESIGTGYARGRCRQRQVGHPDGRVNYDSTRCRAGKHVDGGARRQAFVLVTSHLRQLWAESGGSAFDVYAIVNRELVPPRACAMKNSLLFNGKRGLEILVSEAINFRLSCIPHGEAFEYPVDEFPRREMRELNEAGKAWGADPVCIDDGGRRLAGWCTALPSSETSEVPCP